MAGDSPSSGSALYDRLGGHEGILRLITPFYARVRQHPVLGPVFDERITDWTAHLRKITEFWARMTGGPSSYPGGMGRHLSLPVGGEHFAAWLGLWDENARAQLAPEEADEMSRLAHAIGQDLQRMLARFRPQFEQGSDGPAGA